MYAIVFVMTAPRATIDGYLTQQKLSEVLEAVVGPHAWRGGEILVAHGRRQRWDMVYENASGKVAVEYDGDEHYRNSLKIKTDREKDLLAAQHGFRVVRVPYWVQLTTDTVRHYFGFAAEIAQNFPHGFITTKLFPASFCELGIARFRSELATLPDAVGEAVVESLRARANEHGIEYVVPTSLRQLLKSR